MPFLAVKQKGRSKAQSMVEFALVLPILLVIVYGLLEVGRLIFIYSTVVTAAREAARYGSATGLVSGTEQYKDCTGIRYAAQRVDFLNAIDDIAIAYASNPGQPTTYNITSCPPGDLASGARIRVTVTASFTPLAAIVPLNPITITLSNARTIIGSVQLLP